MSYIYRNITAMNRQQAKQIAETITNDQLNQMFKNVAETMKDWEATGRVNKGMTKGAAFSILSKGFGKDFDPSKNISSIAKTNMVHEFWEYLPPELIMPKQPPKVYPKPFHREPNNLDDFLF